MIFWKNILLLWSGKVNESGRVDAPIARKDGSIIERCVDFDNGEDAVTLYSKIGYNSDLDLSLIKCRLLTGKTHQIRVHMSYIGHPLLRRYFIWYN